MAQEDKQAKQVVESIKEHLKSKGRLDKVDEIIFTNIEKAIRTLILAEKDIDARGILTANRFGELVSNPSNKIANDARIQINKAFENLDLTVKQRFKEQAPKAELTPFEKFIEKR